MGTALPDRSSMPYRDCVGIVLFNAEGKVFTARRILSGDPADTSEVAAPWQLPQGGIDPGEEALPAAYRELFEETGIRTIRLIEQVPDWIHYDLPDAVLGIALKGKYRGQRQKWFAFLFEGEEDEIVLSSETPGLDPEFDDWRWDDLDRLPDIVVPFKRPAYIEVCAALAHLPARIRAEAQ